MFSEKLWFLCFLRVLPFITLLLSDSVETLCSLSTSQYVSMPMILFFAFRKIFRQNLDFMWYLDIFSLGFIYLFFLNEFIIINVYVQIIYYLIDIEIISYIYFIIFVVGMNMDIVISECSPEKFVSAWMSFVILRICSEEAKLKFPEVEKVALKICLLNSHLSFNETCLHIYIYIYI